MASPQSLVGRLWVGIDVFAFTRHPCRGKSIIKEGLNCISPLIYKYRLCWHGPVLARKPLDIGEHVQVYPASAVKMSEMVGAVQKGC